MSNSMKILVALEFSEKPEVILKEALSIAKKYEAKIFTIHVIEEIPRQSFYYDAYQVWEDFRDKAVKETIEKMMTYIKTLSKDFDDIESIIEVGNTAEKIIEKSEELDVDLIIVGHHTGRGVFSHMLHDNVCEKVVRHSKKPVLSFNIEG